MLQLLFRFLWMHLGLQILHLFFPWLQNAEPPQSRHLVLSFLWTQKNVVLEQSGQSAFVSACEQSTRWHSLHVL